MIQLIFSNLYRIEYQAFLKRCIFQRFIGYNSKFTFDQKLHDEELSNEEFSFTFNAESAANVQAFSGYAQICVGIISTIPSQTNPSSTVSTQSTTSYPNVVPNDCVEVANVPR